MSERLSYRFGPLERRGILGPSAPARRPRSPRAHCWRSRSSIEPPPRRAPCSPQSPSGSLVLIALAPVGRRTAEEWAPVIAAFALRRLLRRGRFRSPLPTRGLFADERSAPKRRTIARTSTGDSARAARRVDRADRLPRPLDRRDPRAARPAPDRGAGVPRGRVLAARSRGAGATPRAVGAGARGRSRHVACAGSSGSNAPPRPRATSWPGGCSRRAIRPLPPRGTAMIESYLELIDATAKVTQEHEILVAVQVDGRHRESGAGIALGRTGRADRADRAGARGG